MLKLSGRACKKRNNFTINMAVIFYKGCSRTDVEDNEFIKFTLSTGTYSIDDFNAKVKVAILQERQDWEPPQIKPQSP